jgi:hypothetical protein
MISGPMPSPGITAIVLLMGKLLERNNEQRARTGRKQTHRAQAENRSIIADTAPHEQ